MKIAFICVNYNNSKITSDYVKNIIRIKQNNEIKIIVVDNASKQEDIIHLKDDIKDLLQENIILIELDENLGYFKGINHGIVAFNPKEYDFVVVGNNDLNFPDDFLRNLENKKTENEVLVIAPNIIKPNGIHQNPHVITRVSKTRKFLYDIYFLNYFWAKIIITLSICFNKKQSELDKIFYDKEQYIYMGFGACYILKRIFFDYFEKLDDSVFLMGEEALLANQIASVNKKILYVPSIIVDHEDHVTFKKLPSKYVYQITQKSYKIYKKYL